jgi:lipid-A-disaccharide synthase-like uncharacterized protein
MLRIRRQDLMVIISSLSKLQVVIWLAIKMETSSSTVLNAPHTLNYTVQFNCVKKTARKTEPNVLWHSTGFSSGLSVFYQFLSVPWDDVMLVSEGKLRKLWDSLSELRSSLCERRLERTVLRPALLPVKTAQFTQFFRQVWYHTVKSLSLTL